MIPNPPTLAESVALYRDAIGPIDVPLRVLGQLLIDEPAAPGADLIRDGWLGDVASRVVGYATTSSDMMRLYCEHLFHNPNPAPRSGKMAVNLRQWPFTHIDWDAAADEFIRNDGLDLIWWVDGWVIHRRQPYSFDEEMPF